MRGNTTTHQNVIKNPIVVQHGTSLLGFRCVQPSPEVMAIHNSGITGLADGITYPGFYEAMQAGNTYSGPAGMIVVVIVGNMKKIITVVKDADLCESVIHMHSF
jgi:hypothetical protein